MWERKLKTFIVQPNINRKYKIKNLIGKGTFGSVHIGERIVDPHYHLDPFEEGCHESKQVAVKIILIKSLMDCQDAIDTLASEVISHWKFGRCGGVVSLLEVFEEGEYVYFVQELQEKGTLLGKIIGQLIFEERHIKFMMIQLLMSVDFIHRKGFMHRDLKPENILVNSDKNGFLKLMVADLGLVVQLP